MTGVGGGVVTHAGRGVDICQERPRAGQGHVDNQTGLKHSAIRSKIFLNKMDGEGSFVFGHSTFSTFFSRAIKSFGVALIFSMIFDPHNHL